MMRYVLSRQIVWRLSGLTYATGVIATRGRFLSKQDYLSQSERQMRELPARPTPVETVLEFGCGLGGNLISLSKDIARGFGVDINPGFIRTAKKISEDVAATNLTFLRCTATSLPTLPAIDLVYSIGVFERLSRQMVEAALARLSRLLTPRGRMVLYFLSQRARGSAFTRRLGDKAYTFWTTAEVEHLASGLELGIQFAGPWQSVGGLTSVADVYVMAHPSGVPIQN